MGYKQCDGLVFLVAWGGVLGGVGLVRVGVLGVSFFFWLFLNFFFYLLVSLWLSLLVIFVVMFCKGGGCRFAKKKNPSFAFKIWRENPS